MLVLGMVRRHIKDVAFEVNQERLVLTSRKWGSAFSRETVGCTHKGLGTLKYLRQGMVNCGCLWAKSSSLLIFVWPVDYQWFLHF